MTGPLLSYSRVGGRPPVDHELLSIDADGSFTLWRSISVASRPPSPVGRFAGRTDPDAIAAAAGSLAGEVTLPLPAGASTETVRLTGATLTGPNDGPVPDEWRAVVELARALLGELTGQPVAALALRRDPYTLVHVGDDPLGADLSGAVVRVVTWDGPAVTGATETPLGVTEREVGPGWSLGLTVSSPPPVTVEVEGVRLHDGTQWRDCSLSLHVD